MSKPKWLRKEEKQLKMHNKKLVKKYPWLAPRDYWSGKIDKNYDYTWINWGWGKGWDIAFGQMYMDELGDAIKKSGLQKSFCILEVKEKYGQARCYTNTGDKEIFSIIDKYETISEHVCMVCGKPDVHMTYAGWWYPCCKECWEKSKYNKLPYEEVIIPDADVNIPDEYKETADKIRRQYEKKKKKQ